MHRYLGIGFKAIIITTLGHALAFSQVEALISERFPGQTPYPHLTFRAYPLYPISPKLSITAEDKQRLPFQELGKSLDEKLSSVHADAFRTLLSEIPEAARKELLEQIGEELKVPLKTPSLFAHEIRSSSAATWLTAHYYLNSIAQLSDSLNVKNIRMDMLPSPARSRCCIAKTEAVTQNVC